MLEIPDAPIQHTSDKAIAEHLINNVIWVTALSRHCPELSYELKESLPRSLYTATELRTTVDARMGRDETICQPSDGIIVAIT